MWRQRAFGSFKYYLMVKNYGSWGTAQEFSFIIEWISCNNYFHIISFMHMMMPLSLKFYWEIFLLSFSMLQVSNYMGFQRDRSITGQNCSPDTRIWQTTIIQQDHYEIFSNSAKSSPNMSVASIELFYGVSTWSFLVRLQGWVICSKNC